MNTLLHARKPLGLSRAEYEALVDDLRSASLKLQSDSDYSRYMFASLHSCIAFDSASLNCWVVRPGMIIPEVRSFFYRQDDTMESSYQRHSHLDFFTPLLLTNPLQAFHTGAFSPIDPIYQSPFYLKHAKRFAVEHALASSAKVPNHHDRYIALYLYSADRRSSFEQVDANLLEMIFPILFCLWLNRFGLIDTYTMELKLRILKTFGGAPRMLDLIRLVVREPTGTSESYARALGITKQAVDRSLEAIYRKMSIAGSKNKRLLLYKSFSFLNQ